MVHGNGRMSSQQASQDLLRKMDAFRAARVRARQNGEVVLHEKGGKVKKRREVAIKAPVDSDRADALRWLQQIVQPGEVTEIFVKEIHDAGGKTNAHLTGYYDRDHIDKLVEDVLSWSGKATGIYYRINRVDPAFISRCRNRLGSTRSVLCSKEGDIARRRLLLLDIDPVRPPDSAAATSKEKKLARAVADQVRQFLVDKGWPHPALIDSGNGYYLMYRINLPADDGGLLKRVISTISRQFSNKNAWLDTRVFDAVRLARLPGTLNCKGDSSPDRPHRPCRVIKWPKKGLKIVPIALLEQLVSNGTPVSAIGPCLGKMTSQDVLDRARVYVSKMPPAISGQGGHSALFAVACRLIIGFDLTKEQAWPILKHYNERCEPLWSEPELNRKLDEADKQGTVTGEPRGLLRDAHGDGLPEYAGWEPLSGSEFQGYVPDFGDVHANEVLISLSAFAGCPHEWFIELFLIWKLLLALIAIPDTFLRQLMWGDRYPRNWRRELRKRLNAKTVEETPPEYKCKAHNCILHGSGRRHRHFCSRIMKRGLLEKFADGTGVRRNFLVYEPEMAETQKLHRSKGWLIKLYWPALLFGLSQRINWTYGEVRLLLAITYELTRSGIREPGSSNALIVTGAQVPTPSTGNRLVICPQLNPNTDYVVFGGNGRRAGRGYQIFGRTDKGWFQRAGYPAIPNLKLRVSAMPLFFEGLHQLAKDLDLTVVGCHPRHRRTWKGIDEMIAGIQTHAGQEWLFGCSLRIYAPTDWLVRWRYFFSKRLGFRWIPAYAGDLGPSPSHAQPAADGAIKEGWQLAKLLKGWNCTQQQLARELEKILRRRVSPRRVSRHISGESQTREFFEAVNDLRRRRSG